ncbi:MAG: SRPBCC family protein [Cyanobacteria bacterium Co-bin13]|nr:SRPBCC family protein [Cyanobacteria bacterium Co-bin13]
MNSPLTSARAFLARLRHQKTLDRSYWTVSSASVDTLWQTIMNLADVSWHPLLSSTNAPNGLSPKPGLIYRAFTRICPIPVSIFVERVLPRELLTVRLFPVPGLEERVTYEIKSTVMGTQISYSVTLRGWLTPLAWSLLKPYAARVASALANAAEQTSTLGKCKPSSQPW